MSDSGPNETFEPEITVFTCNYCAYMSADTAGALRLQYPANIKLVRLPCTGKTEVSYLLNAFEQGADGVYIVGCPLGNCHHVRGNERGQARVKMVGGDWPGCRSAGHVFHLRGDGSHLRSARRRDDRADSGFGTESVAMR
jgi:hypothetical protein